MARNVKSIAAAMLLCFAGAVGLQAQDSVLAELYGRGVHAYYSHQYDRAADYLGTAAKQGSTDPRVHYYLGLIYYETGRPDEAVAAFKRAAQLEAQSTDRIYEVARALQRVQGPVRLEIEEYRTVARAAAREREQARARARYGDLQRAEQEGALRRLPSATPPAEPTPPSEPADPAEAPEAGDPFSVEPDPNAPAVPATPAPATPPPATPATDDPFGGEAPAEPATPPADDPFGAAPETEEPAAPATNDPFGDAPATEEPAAPATDDPFGNAPATDEPAAPAENDPFGNAPATEEPEEESADPFGALQPRQPAAAQPAAADPFGAGDLPETESPAPDPAATTAAPATPATGGGRGAIGGLFRALRSAAGVPTPGAPIPEAQPPAANPANPADPFGAP